MAIGMDTQKIEDIKKVDFCIAANIENAGPKRNATSVNNAERITAISQTKSDEKAQSTIPGADDGDPAVSALQFTDKRLDQITKELTDLSLGTAPRYALLMETNRLSVAAQTVIMAAQKEQQLHEAVMRRMLLDS